VREKYCWLAGGWWLVLNWCERKALLAGWQPAEQGQGFERKLALRHGCLNKEQHISMRLSAVFCLSL
jgi:hypothetical protein